VAGAGPLAGLVLTSYGRNGEHIKSTKPAVLSVHGISVVDVQTTFTIDTNAAETVEWWFNSVEQQPMYTCAERVWFLCLMTSTVGCCAALLPVHDRCCKGFGLLTWLALTLLPLHACIHSVQSNPSATAVTHSKTAALHGCSSHPHWTLESSLLSLR
jgi:hypothetical protein